METMDGISAGWVGGHHLTEPVDTPMPLRISKKREPEHPDDCRRQRSTPVATSPTFQTLRTVPTRQTSLPRSHTRIGILGEHPAASNAQRSNEMHSLHIAKHRDTATATSVNPDKAYPRATAPPTGLQGRGQLSNENTLPELNKRLKENTLTFNIDKVPQRASTTGSMLSSELLSPFHDGPLIPPAPTPLVTRSRSSATVRRGSNRDVIKHEHDDQPAHQGISRRASLRERLVSRVMNGLTSRQNASHELMEHDGSSKKHKAITQEYYDETTKHRDEIAPKHSDETSRQRNGWSTHKRANSTVSSSLNSNPLVDSILDNTLSAFPAPPTITNFTASTTFPSMAAMGAGIEMPKSSQAFEGVAIVGAEINTVAETAYLECEHAQDAQSVFVAVEIKGILNQPEDGPEPQRHGLEVAVVIDNSLLSSPATLMASCEGARYLASLLDMPDDRLAVLCTSPGHLTAPSRIVYRLSAVSARQVKSAVDTIVGSMEQPDHEAAWATIECAKELLTSTTSAQSRDNLDTSGQIFVFTANPSGLPPALLYQGLHVHVICPGTVPWKGQRNVQCNGWKLRSLCRSGPEFVGDMNQPDITALSTQFRTVISRARCGKISGRLTDLVLELNAGHNCSIEGVIGKKTYSSLRPGEIITALVKVKVGAWRRYGSSSSLSQDSDSPPNSLDLLDELDLMLGATSTTLLTAKLKYKHSLFPTGTRCSIASYSQVKHQVSGTKRDKDPPKASQCPIWVQKRLIFQLATHHSPGNAIVTLSSQFGADGRNSVCPNYFRLVIDELKYQARVLERLESSDVDSIIASDHDNLYEHFGQGLFDIENFKPVEWMPEAPEESAKDPQESVQAEAWNARALDLGVSRYDTRMEGEWLANAPHKNAISTAPKRAEKAGVLDTADKDDGSDHSTVVGAQSKYTLYAPSTGRETRKFRELIKSAFKENRTPGDAEIMSHQIHQGSGNKNLSASRPGTPIGQTHQGNRVKNMSGSQPNTPIGQPRGYDDGSLRPISPFTPRVYKSPQQPHLPSPQQQSTLRMAPTSSDSSDDAHKIWHDMGKQSMGGDSNNYQPTRPMYGGPRPPPEYPQVIVAKDEEDRARLIREFALKNQRSLGEGTLRSFAAAGPTEGTSRGGDRAFGSPWI